VKEIVAALIIALGIAAAGYLSVPNYQLVQSGDAESSIVYRLNTKTGKVCALNDVLKRLIHSCGEDISESHTWVNMPRERTPNESLD